MEYNDILEELKKYLSEKLPSAEYQKRLSEILGVDSRTISRKLSGETHFTIHDVVRIANYFDISLNSLSNQNNNKHSLEIYYHDFSSSYEYQKLSGKSLEVYRYAVQSKNTVYKVISSSFPEFFNAKYTNIALFTSLQWLYFNKGESSVIPISEARLTAKDKELHKEYLELVFNMKSSKYVFSNNMISNIGEMIIYFYEIKILNKDEINLLTIEYSEALDFIENLCLEGRLPDTGKEVEIYFSTITIPNDMVIIESDNINLGVLYAFYLNPIVTMRPETFDIFNSWFNSLLHSSSIISLSNPSQRQHFFSKQRKDLENLRNRFFNS